MQPFDMSLLPVSAAVDETGRCTLGGCVLSDLADRFGTPLFVYDESELRRRMRSYVEAFGEGAVAYAGKAALFGALAQIVRDEGLDLDIASGGELDLAIRSGFPAERVVFHGNNKSSAELAAALAAGVGRIVVDSLDELDRLDALTGSGPGAVPVLIRVTPGVEAHTHEFIETGTEDSKFGFALDGGAAIDAARRVASSPGLELRGLHCHIGSQVVRLDSFTRAAEKMARLVEAVESDLGIESEELSLGGGLGVRHVADDPTVDVAEYAAHLRDAVTRALAASHVRSRPRLTVEPGRSIAAPSAVTLYRVGTIKHIDGVATYVAVDGGMSDNPRPITYGARYEAFVPDRVRADRPLRATVAGKHCEQGDLLVRDAALPADTEVGDVVAIPVTGAYALSMASNYNRVPRPAVVLVRDGEAELVVRRETPDDLVRLDLVAGGEGPS